ncbi:potassium channel family protein [Desulfoscipio geothermicus]|uniref:Voltage-gated potassium channel n=1 Tax=Desulfoscipio geothermicus DSM 3669 TaxID=1121426 RepID=A0A1I6DPM7_9FIRM|nr:potassium channel protein [Desulfoscipio geothermicus]SFR07394.1 voltage-gated potassium channel [Desulfoscipio geothermicus DSM 3669]
MHLIINFLRKLKIIYQAHANYKLVLMFLLTLIVGGALLIYFLEKDVNEQFAGLGDGLWWSIVTITTVGYGDKFPITTGGRLVALAVMFGGIGSFGYIAGSLLEDLIRRERGEMKVSFSDHFIICDYSYKVENICKELKNEIKNCKIVLIANREENPVKETTGVHFIRGDSTKESVIEKANVQKASTVIVLADSAMDERLADAHSVLTTLAVRHMNPSCKIIAESLNPENIEHFRRAGANEIICTGEISGQLIFRSSIYNGLTQMLRELITNRFGNELYSGAVPDYLVNVEFSAALVKMQEKGAILLGIYRDNELYTNPAPDTVIRNGDKLVYIAKNTLF